MSEHLHQSPEHTTESIDTSAEQSRNAERLREHAEQTPDINKKSVEHLQHDAKEQAVSGKEINVGEHHEDSNGPTFSKGLKQQSYQKSLQRIRHHLSASQRVLSRVIHQPTVEKVSSVGGQTVARSSGILGGAVFAFVGSVGLVIVARHVGFTYNYLVFFVLFIGGFVVGLMVELLIRVLRLSKR